MTSKIDWEMRVAVISDRHMPQGFDPANLDGPVYFDDPMGWAVMVSIDDLDCHNGVEWLKAVKGGLPQCSDGASYNWVRFDPDADVIEGVPVYSRT